MEGLGIAAPTKEGSDASSGIHVPGRLSLIVAVSGLGHLIMIGKLIPM
jgi:hypothetical protein